MSSNSTIAAVVLVGVVALVVGLAVWFLVKKPAKPVPGGGGGGSRAYGRRPHGCSEYPSSGHGMPSCRPPPPMPGRPPCGDVSAECQYWGGRDGVVVTGGENNAIYAVHAGTVHDPYTGVDRERCRHLESFVPLTACSSVRATEPPYAGSRIGCSLTEDEQSRMLGGAAD